jgi:HMW1C N-terminal/HMW1 domain 2
MAFSLERFEALAYSRNRELGMRELLELLKDLDANYGNVSDQFKAQPLQSVSEQDMNQHVWTRAVAAASCLLADRELFIAPEWRQNILAYHRWLSALFAATPFRNADHVMRALNVKEGDDQSDLRQLQINEADLLKFCLLYSPESEVPLDLDALWAADKVMAAGLCLVLLSPRFLGSPAAHSKREQILPWLTDRLDLIDDIEQLPLGVLHDLYMHCSYADRADKHDIKKSINSLIKRKLILNRFHDWDRDDYDPFRSKKAGEKPVLLVVLEWFTKGHSIYRTHSLTMEAAREHFYVVAMAYDNCTDEVTRKVFDEVVIISRNNSLLDQLKQIQQEAKKRKVSICYMPSVGMFPLTMWLTNLRVAPLQMMALGHPATTHAHAIDYVVVEEDYVGSDACFSEKLLKLPSDGMPYRPSAAAEGLKVIVKPQLKPDVVRIAMCATTMKLNPKFLETCVRIIQSSSVPLHFQFLIGQAQGLTYPSVQRLVAQYLGDHATVFPHQHYTAYMDIIAGCDMFINPFPFGNTNGIIDTISAGLVGICKTGPEVHEHIDEGLFRRMGLPDWLIAKTEDEYVSAAVRLATNHEERVALRERYAGEGKVDVLFQGRPHIMGEKFLQCLTSF